MVIYYNLLSTNFLSVQL